MRLKLNPIAKRSPYGGHHYPEYGITFRGDSLDEVVARLSDFRIHNAIPLGDPHQEVLLFYARHWPWLVREDHEAAEPEPDGMYERWRSWIHERWGKSHKLVSPQEAFDRACICKDCPYNLPFSFPETKESAELTRRSFLLRRGYPAPEGIHFCELHGADLAAFSFQAETGPRLEGQPVVCWVGLDL